MVKVEKGIVRQERGIMGGTKGEQSRRRRQCD
jgi:hypothetical protein